MLYNHIIFSHIRVSQSIVQIFTCNSAGAPLTVNAVVAITTNNRYFIMRYLIKYIIELNFCLMAWTVYKDKYNLASSNFLVSYLSIKIWTNLYPFVRINNRLNNISTYSFYLTSHTAILKIEVLQIYIVVWKF